MREDVLKQRYYRKDENGQTIEDWTGLCRRVAEVCGEEKNEQEEFFNVLHKCLFLPNSPTLMNAGKKMSYSACFVLPVGDSMEEIFGAVRETALIQKSGGGTGFDFSRLRPAGDTVSSTKGVASGPCSFIQVFNAATDVIKQGSTRRGANMGILRVDHPDIMEFIAMKKQEGHLANFNISIAITNAFMKALGKDGEIPLFFNGKTYRVIKAKRVWDAIIEGAWRNGEPGIVYIDEVNRHNLLPHLGRIEATNPCVTGDTLVATPEGYKRADSFNIGDEILTVAGVGVVDSIEVHEDMPVYKVEFTSGDYVIATLSHQFYAKNRYDTGDEFKPIILRNLSTGDLVRKLEGTAKRIISITLFGTAKVYDLHEPKTDTWITNGYVSRGCGEQPLLPYEACVLGSVNLAKMVTNDKQINWTLLETTVRTGVRMLDNIIDIQTYSLPEIEKMHKANRKIGLGIMGWADMLLLLGIKYDSEEALTLAEKVMAFIENISFEESKELAKRKGVFQTWEGSLWEKKGILIRNATTTTIAPTGTLSIIAECSSGIEPVFAWETIQKRPVGEHSVVHPIYKTFKDAGKSIPEYFVTAGEIAPEWHIKMQAAFQKYTHNAVSKTVNLPNSDKGRHRKGF